MFTRMAEEKSVQPSRREGRLPEDLRMFPGMKDRLSTRRRVGLAVSVLCAATLPFAAACNPIVAQPGGGHPVTAPAPTSVQPLGVAGDWKVTADDEFNGTSLNSNM